MERQRWEIHRHAERSRRARVSGMFQPGQQVPRERGQGYDGQGVGGEHGQVEGGFDGA